MTKLPSKQASRRKKEADRTSADAKLTKLQSKSFKNSWTRNARSIPKAKSMPPRTESQYTVTPEKFKDTWGRVLEVVSRMRRENVSLTQASREVGVTPRAVTKWGKQALRKGSNGKYAVTKRDSLLRLLLIPTPDGTREIAVRGSKDASRVAKYSNAVHRYLQTGDASRLKSFIGKKIKDANGVEIPFMTDQPSLNRLGSAGVLSFESIYARTR